LPTDFSQGRCSWRRPLEFLGKQQHDIVVFEDGITASDIKQGQLGNCWFLSALGALTEISHLVENLFFSDKTNAAGVYSVKFCKGGIWQVVVVDDFFPCKPRADPVFSHANGDELWVLVLEKAAAKLHGGYQHLIAGDPAHAMRDLAGCPVTTIVIDNDAGRAAIADGSMFLQLLEFRRCNYLMNASTNSDDASPCGLHPGHGYSILDVHEYQGKQLLRLRNPWGSGEWTGPWSDSDQTNWTPHAKKELEYSDEDDGCFWMDFNDFCIHFYKIVAGFVRTRQGTAFAETRWADAFRMGEVAADKALSATAQNMFVSPLLVVSTQIISHLFHTIPMCIILCWKDSSMLLIIR
jgi:calpain-15